jgi:hypothetical protein
MVDSVPMTRWRASIENRRDTNLNQYYMWTAPIQWPIPNRCCIVVVDHGSDGFEKGVPTPQIGESRQWRVA